MFDVVEKSVATISKAAALPAHYLEEALGALNCAELFDLVADFEILSKTGKFTARIIELMKRARLIADADRMMARFEAA